MVIRNTFKRRKSIITYVGFCCEKRENPKLFLVYIKEKYTYHKTQEMGGFCIHEGRKSIMEGRIADKEISFTINDISSEDIKTTPFRGIIKENSIKGSLGVNCKRDLCLLKYDYFLNNYPKKEKQLILDEIKVLERKVFGK